MSNTETKIKEMDMTDSTRCFFVLFFKDLEMMDEWYIARARLHTRS